MTTPPSSLPPANWYPDPQTPGQLRYWDGQRWTQHVHPAQQPAQGVGGVGALPAQAGPGVFLPSGRPGSAQPGGGSVQGQGTFSPTQAGPAQGVFSPAQAGPAQGVFSPAQAGPAQGVFSPTQAGPAQGVFAPTQGIPVQGGAGQGVFSPTQAGPAQGVFAPAQAAPLAAGPATGALRTFQPAGAAGASPFPTTMQGSASLDLDDIPRGRGGRAGLDPYDSVESSGTSTAAKIASLVGFLALLATVASVYGLGTGFDSAVTYAAGGLGFLAVLLGFSGVAKSLRGEGGRGRSIVAICIGFLAIGLNTYEYLYPRELYDVFAGFFPK